MFATSRQALEGDCFGEWLCNLEGEDHTDNFFGESYLFVPYQHKGVGIFTGVDAFGYPAAVTVDSNLNLDAPQRELLSWHHKLGCGFSRIQALMKGHERTDESGQSMYYPPVITPRKPSAASCPIPKAAALSS